MKLTSLLFIFALIQVSAETYSQTARLTLNMEDASLATLFEEIEKTSDFHFFYDSSSLDLSQKMTITVEDSNIETVLDKLFGESGISYEIYDRYIILKGKAGSNAKNGAAVQQQHAVSGSVTDKGKQPLPGVTVIIKGTSDGTVTDFDGNYTLNNVPENATLQFSFVGMRTQEVEVSGQNVINVRLEEETIGIEEVVAIGYGTQKKSDLTGAVAAVSGDELATSSNISVGGALQGKLSGLSIISKSGFPGSETSINIRGVGTFGSGDNRPLVVIDGIPVENGFETLNPTDIESVNVLKDASSAAIYGSRAANGVILVTTKKGTSGKAKVNINAHYGMQSPSNIIDVLSAKEFVSAIQEMAANKKAIDGGNPTTKYDGLNPADFGKGTVWSDYIYKSAPTYDVNASINGGSENMLYYMSGEFLSQDGIGINTGFKKGTLRANVQGNVSDKVTVGNNIHLAYMYTTGSSDNRYSDVIFNAPITDAYDEDGSYGEPGSLTASKNAIAEVAWRTPENNNYRVMDNFFLEMNFTDWLKFRFNGAVDMVYNEYSLFSPLYNDGGQTNSVNSLVNEREKNLMWVTDYLLYADKKFGDHTLNAMAGFSQQLISVDNLYGGVKDFVSEVDNMQVIDGGTNSVERDLSGGKSELALASYFGRINYDYKQKYLFSFNLRADGSSRFKGDNRWGVFPSFSGGWRLSEEDFFSSAIVNSLKLRASWGQLGNQSIGSWYPTIAPVAKQNVILGAGGNNQQLYSGYSQTVLGNPNLKWETTSVTNIGFDLGLYKNKIFFTADYFIKNTDGILRTMVLPLSVGMGAPNVNYAQVQNSGVDLDLTYKGQVNDFSYSIAANASFLKNQIKKLSEGIDEEVISIGSYGGVTINRVGEPISALYGYKTNGLITTPEQAQKMKDMGQGNAKVGRLAYVDANGDKKIDGDDRVILGSYIPKVTLGTTLSANWRNFDFNAVFSAVLGRKQHSPMSFQNRMPNRNMSRKWYDNRWVLGEDAEGKYPAIIQSESYEEMTDLMVSNTSFMKMRSISLGYSHTFSDFKARMYVTGENLLTVTHKDFDGFDPENGNSVGHYTNWGYDYPTAKIFIVGVNVEF
ncbi:TonB-dependent receptor [Mariniphaga anaerophila]|nr:TonB-dependent receptor [Mariniphaga anaerophila]